MMQRTLRTMSRENRTLVIRPLATLLATLLLATLLLVGAAGPAHASGSSTISPAVGSVDPLTVTEVVKCEVTRISQTGTVFVREGEGEPERLLSVSDETHIVAQKKKDFDGRKKLAPEDLQIGQRLKVTVRPATREVLRIKVLQKG